MLHRHLFASALVVIALGASAMDADSLTIRSWDDANQRGEDLFGASPGDFTYGALEDAILARGHTILPGVATLTAANLTGVDVFFHGTSSHILSPAEQAALVTFIAGGGALLIEANSIAEEQASANSALSALGLGKPYNGAIGGDQSSNAGSFSTLATCTTLGSLGDLRGLTFGSSVATDITPGTGTIVGTNSTITCMVEFAPAGGRVLACGDPYGFGLFTELGAGSYNPNNAAAYLNFIECSIATPVEQVTWGAIKAVYH